MTLAFDVLLRGKRYQRSRSRRCAHPILVILNHNDRSPFLPSPDQMPRQHHPLRRGHWLRDRTYRRSGKPINRSWREDNATHCPRPTLSGARRPRRVSGSPITTTVLFLTWLSSIASIPYSGTLFWVLSPPITNPKHRHHCPRRTTKVER